MRTDGWTERRTSMMKLIVTIHNSVNTPKDVDNNCLGCFMKRIIYSMSRFRKAINMLEAPC